MWRVIYYLLKSDGYREFRQRNGMGRGGRAMRGSGVQGVWVVSSGVQVLVFWSLKRQAARLRSRNQKTSNTITVEFRGLPISALWTIPQYVCALMNYSGSYANQTMERETLHVLRVCWSAGVFSVGVWEPKGGNWATFSPLFCVGT